MKVIQSYRQTARQLYFFRPKCTPAILFYMYLYAGPHIGIPYPIS